MGSLLILEGVQPDKRAKAIEEAARIIAQGGIVAFPTESFYGLAVDPVNEAALRRLLEVKQRPSGNPILLLISDQSQLPIYVTEVPKTAQILMEEVWPGSLTLVFNAKSQVSPLITGGTGKVGLRISSNPIAGALTKAVGSAITGTSANLSAQPPCLRAEEVARELNETIDAVIDGGRCDGGPGTTVLDVTCEPPRIIREGMVSRARLEELLGQKVSV